MQKKWNTNTKSFVSFLINGVRYITCKAYNTNDDTIATENRLTSNIKFKKQSCLYTDARWSDVGDTKQRRIDKVRSHTSNAQRVNYTLTVPLTDDKRQNTNARRIRTHYLTFFATLKVFFLQRKLQWKAFSLKW